MTKQKEIQSIRDHVEKIKLKMFKETISGTIYTPDYDRDKEWALSIINNLLKIIETQSNALTLVHPDNFHYDESNDHIAREILIAKEDVEKLMKGLG